MRLLTQGLLANSPSTFQLRKPDRESQLP